jgi:nucleotide-binding universal stress UspA family protein
MIPQIKKILYATDLSKNSAYAFYYAVDMAKKHDAKIIFLHAIEPIPASAYGTYTDKLERGEQEASMEVIRNRLRNFCEKAEEKDNLACLALVSRIVVRVGYPVEEILKAADEEGCDVIVLGNHGKGFLQQTFLGSISRSVLDRTRKPVFIVPLPPEEVSFWDEM